MIRTSLQRVALAGLLVVLAAPEGWAGPPTDQLKGSIDRVIRRWTVRALKGEAKAAERRRARCARSPTTSSTSPRSRAAPSAVTGRGAPDKEREEFVLVFSDLLERSYISKIELYGDEKIVYSGEKIDGDTAAVPPASSPRTAARCRSSTGSLRRGDRWLVYDVSIEGVSLVSNYRTQFNKIIQTSSFTDLLKKMKAKQDEVVLEETSSGGKAKTQ